MTLFKDYPYFKAYKSINLIGNTMYEELRKKAKKKVEAKKGFYIAGVTFGAASIVLIMLSYYLPDIAQWLMLPIPVFFMALGIIYISVFGLTLNRNPEYDWQEEEIEKEMAKLYNKKKMALPPAEDLSEEDRLELKELERLREKWEWGEDYV